ncbi:GDSL esterase/lipase [Actinidia chinensis var. chinensis]|uniref:GDSL esterase/lipase n=1 Tax=Actinidia chinensis var. chinensis TaxID=1590841 RepID=A0A2R6RG70_ACTCC|nr:GDSL esterase/lipase [Actinidia chinensis var. chinensis]
MACELNILFLVLIIISHVHVDGEPQVPCYFIFGDSLVDNGNNNLLPTTAKANYPPYGIDFDGPTGRFCNGRNMADFIAKLLGFANFIPPFATARGQDILMGVNYGSGASGIRDETGQQLGARISMNRQLLNHQITISRIAFLLGSKGAANNYLSQCIYSVGMGSNDYINNYLMPQFYPTSYLYTPDQYADVLIQQYSKQLRTLYNDGARKVAIFGLGLIGCTPAEIVRYGTNGSDCVDKINTDVQLFNKRIKVLVDGLNNDLPNAKFTYINIIEISSGDPSAAGITVINAPCCMVLTNGQCTPNQVPCSDRNKYAFFDGFHPTAIVNFLLAMRSYSAQTPFDAYPVDIRSLAQL